MRDFKTLKCWALAHNLTLEIYKITTSFPPNESFGLTSQMRKSSSSIPTNIAEGCGRKTKADFSRFLDIAIGSSNELEYQLLLAKDLNYILIPKYSELSEKVIEVRKTTNGYQKSMWANT